MLRNFHRPRRPKQPKHPPQPPAADSFLNFCHSCSDDGDRGDARSCSTEVTAVASDLSGSSSSSIGGSSTYSGSAGGGGGRLGGRPDGSGAPRVDFHGSSAPRMQSQPVRRGACDASGIGGSGDGGSGAIGHDCGRRYSDHGREDSGRRTSIGASGSGGADGRQEYGRRTSSCDTSPPSYDIPRIASNVGFGGSLSLEDLEDLMALERAALKEGAGRLVDLQAAVDELCDIKRTGAAEVGDRTDAASPPKKPLKSCLRPSPKRLVRSTSSLNIGRLAVSSDVPSCIADNDAPRRWPPPPPPPRRRRNLNSSDSDLDYVKDRSSFCGIIDDTDSNSFDTPASIGNGLGSTSMEEALSSSYTSQTASIHARMRSGRDGRSNNESSRTSGCDTSRYSLDRRSCPSNTGSKEEYHTFLAESLSGLQLQPSVATRSNVRRRRGSRSDSYARKSSSSSRDKNDDEGAIIHRVIDISKVPSERSRSRSQEQLSREALKRSTRSSRDPSAGRSTREASLEHRPRSRSRSRSIQRSKSQIAAELNSSISSLNSLITRELENDSDDDDIQEKSRSPCDPPATRAGSRSRRSRGRAASRSRKDGSRSRAGAAESNGSCMSKIAQRLGRSRSRGGGGRSASRSRNDGESNDGSSVIKMARKLRAKSPLTSSLKRLSMTSSHGRAAPAASLSAEDGEDALMASRATLSYQVAPPPPPPSKKGSGGGDGVMSRRRSSSASHRRGRSSSLSRHASRVLSALDATASLADECRSSPCPASGASCIDNCHGSHSFANVDPPSSSSSTKGYHGVSLAETTWGDSNASMAYDDVPFDPSSGMCIYHPGVCMAVRIDRRGDEVKEYGAQASGWKIVRTSCPKCTYNY